MMGSSSSWSSQTFGSFSSSPGAGFGQAMGSVSSTPWEVSEKGSRVCAYAPTTDDNPSQVFYLQSISAMLVYRNKSHEELRHEDYERRNRGGDSLQKSITSGPIFPVSSSPSFCLSCSSTPSFTSNPRTRFIGPFPETNKHPTVELQPPRGPTSSSNPFCLPFAARSSFSSGDLQSSTQGLSYSTPGLSFYRYLPSNLAFTRTQTPPPPYTAFQKIPFTYCPSSHPSPLTAHVGGEHTASASTPSMQTTPTLRSPHFSTSASVPGVCRDSIFSNSASASNTAFAGATSTQQGTFSQNFPTVSTQPEKGPVIGSSVIHSEPALSSDARCTRVNVDYPNNTVELDLPFNVRIVRIRFSSSKDGAGTSQVHSDCVAKASEASISLSIYPGENNELTIQSVERTTKNHIGKQSCSTGGSDCSKVHHSTGHPSSRSAGNQNGSNGDAHLTQKSAAAPECEVITGSVLPRLYIADYYTVPSIVELAVKESDQPGYCSRVPDFTVGRHGYGNIKFDGETDVRKLDIASIVEFKNREILIYRDESKTPPVGQGLNKPAEVTLLNVKCIDQKTGLHFTVGPTVDRYKEILVQWTKEHGAEFVSFDPVKGEWKFKVKNFSQS